MSGPTVAVLGGGQLGRMLALAGIPLGLRFRFLDPSPDATAGRVGHLVVAPLDDESGLSEVVEGADVATYEWEGVPAASASFLEARLPVHPGPRALEVAQDRLAEKRCFERLGIPIPPFAPVDDEDGLRAAVREIGLPAVLKTRRGGYDGKGQLVLRDPGEVPEAWSRLGGTPLLLEAHVPFDRELSVVAVRGRDGSTHCYPLVENHHREGILRLTLAPAPDLDRTLQERAEQAVRGLLEDLDHVGVMAVELFQQDGTLLANEMAPRVHNSGHWTIEGAATSQFENHLRAVLGWPLGSADALGASAMVNWIGAMPPAPAVLALEGTHLHDYEKAPRSGRKVGHATVTAPDPATVLRRLTGLAEGTGLDLAWLAPRTGAGERR